MEECAFPPRRDGSTTGRVHDYPSINLNNDAKVLIFIISGALSKKVKSVPEAPPP
jgi:hypothetical protein